jgi:lipoprotein LenA
MRKLIVLLLIPMILLSCKKKPSGETSGDGQTSEPVLKKQYARYAVNIFKDKELKNALTFISKAEEVEADMENKSKNEKGIEVVFVKLTDGQKGYIELRHLAQKPIVFIEDTKAHFRNNVASPVHATIPAGTIGFIIDQKDNWAQVFVGQIKGLWVTQQWIRGGYQSDDKLLIDAKIYEEALALLAKKEKKKAIAKLEELSSSQNIFKELAAKKIEEANAATEETPATTTQPEQGQSERSGQ